MTDPIATRLAAALGPSYDVASLLGRGGMGAVYRATDRRLRRDVAIKVLPPELGYSEELRARFVREAQMAAQLSHPNIVPIYDVGERDDLVWFVMAFIDGESVRAKVEREGPLPISVVRRVLQEVAQALAYAHAKGVIHRDIKPDNILLDRGSGRALVTDFGIAKVLTGADTDLTQPGEVVGTARYMAPEQALAEGPVDARADMYALGLVGYFLLTGTHAIKGMTLPAVIAEHVKGGGVSLRDLARRLPAQLVSAVERCLAPKPEQRFARMEEFVEALRGLGGDLPDVPAPVRKLLRETEWVFIVTTITAFALGLIGVEQVPPALIALIGGGILGQWTLALEQALRRGVGWSALRRALYVERARRVEEVEQWAGPRFGPVSALATFGLFVGAMILLGDVGFASSTPLNIGLFYGGMLGGAVAAKVFGLPGVPRKATRRSRGVLVIGGITVILAAVLIGGVVGAREALSDARPAVAVMTILTLGGVAVLGAFGGWRLIKRLEERQAAREAQGLSRAAEWRLPRWLDVLGSWLFARVVRDGWRIRVEREKPQAIATAELGVSAARQMEKRIHALAGAISGTEYAAVWEARRLARDLVAETGRAEHELKPLLAKVARLSEGVLVERTVAAGGTVETELDRAEHQADALRAHARECAEMLNALAVGLEAVAQGQDTAQLDAALQRARQLSSGVRRGILIAERT